ncbi:thiamine pyrophosphate-binding protein [Arthrobacter sp. Br18]|uniref:thiamine pyrophosphate-binding protein n=1 Tax=Arthrobacter sp. Br18 TaxID=1312954 RepID=UPI00047EED41|nr:thiamine pyrophosphate-binding protein [Arthrobacter sp. Br18]
MAPFTVSSCVARVLADHTSVIFGVMGNGNAYFLDAAEATGITFTAVRHEGGSVPAADAYYRVSGRLAAASTTYGPGFTNVVTGLAEAVQAQVPVVLVTGDAPAAGRRTWDVDQTAIAAAVGALTFTVTTESPAAITRRAIRHALEHRTAVVLAIPYDVATSPAPEEPVLPLPAPAAPALPATEVLTHTAALLTAAKRPLLLAGRGAHLAGAGEELQRLADKLGALTTGTVLARNLLPSRGADLGIAGGFGMEEAAHIMAEADVVLVVGARLTQFTMRFGELINDSAHVIQIDTAESATHPRVDSFLHGDALATTRTLSRLLPDHPPAVSWRATSVRRVAALPPRPLGNEAAPDGRLDPRSVATALNDILPRDRIVVQDGGHFIGWAPMYWEVAGPHALHMVGTAYQTIGLGLASAVGAAVAAPTATTVLVTGDGGLLMALADLESVVRTVRRGVIVVFNDAAYGAEIHQYGAQGVTQQPMTIPDVDFAGMARSLGAHGATIRTMGDLDILRAWLNSAADGVFLADCRVSSTVMAPYMSEIVAASAKARAAARELASV